jgi:RNA polymerase sigma-70 factor (ECF subfamily)
VTTSHSSGRRPQPSGPAPVEASGDDQLVRAAQSGDGAALEALLRSQLDRVHGICRRMCGNDADAEDATQEALISVVKGLPAFDGRSAFSTWVHRVTTNACLDQLRRAARRPQVAGRVDATPSEPDGRSRSIDPADPEPGVEDRLPDRLAIDAALGSLPEEFRIVVVLRDHVGLDYAEIAATLDLPPGTVRSRISRGRARLAELLGPSTDQGNPTAGDGVQGSAP